MLVQQADFSFFFDAGGRRRCYIAPERFYESAGADAALLASQPLSPAMVKNAHHDFACALVSVSSITHRALLVHGAQSSLPLQACSGRVYCNRTHSGNVTTHAPHGQCSGATLLLAAAEDFCGHVFLWHVPGGQI